MLDRKHFKGLIHTNQFKNNVLQNDKNGKKNKNFPHLSDSYKVVIERNGISKTSARMYTVTTYQHFLNNCLCMSRF